MANTTKTPEQIAKDLRAAKVGTVLDSNHVKSMEEAADLLEKSLKKPKVEKDKLITS